MMNRTVVMACVGLLQLSCNLACQVFESERHRLLPYDNSRLAASGDFDGDGDIDLATAGTKLMAWNDGEGRFTDAGQDVGTQPGRIIVALGDVDGDGDLDGVIGRSGTWPVGTLIWFNQDVTSTGDFDGNFASNFWVDAQIHDAHRALA